MPRPKGSKNKNKKSLLAWLESHNWNYAYRFQKAFDESSPEEQLRFFKGTLPYMFQRVDTTPLIEANLLNVEIKKISSYQELKKLIEDDPFIDGDKIIDGEIIDVGEGDNSSGSTGGGNKFIEGGAASDIQDKPPTASAEGHAEGNTK